MTRRVRVPPSIHPHLLLPQASAARAEAAAAGLPPPVGLRRSMRGGEELSILDSLSVRAGGAFAVDDVIEKAFRVASSYPVPAPS